jgi:hypothetical protein
MGDKVIFLSHATADDGFVAVLQLQRVLAGERDLAIGGSGAALGQCS